MNDTIGWGILATGRIARSFAEDLRLVPGGSQALIPFDDSAAHLQAW